MRFLSVLILASTFLVGCSTVDAILHPQPTLVLNLASQLTTAEDSAEIYVALPYCDRVLVPGTTCKDRELVRKLRKYDTAAYTAIKTADQTKTQSDLQAAQSALAAYKSIVALVKGN